MEIVFGKYSNTCHCAHGELMFSINQHHLVVLLVLEEANMRQKRRKEAYRGKLKTENIIQFFIYNFDKLHSGSCITTKVGLVCHPAMGKYGTGTPGFLDLWDYS